MLYFAYGSNLDCEQMARRCPEAEPVRAAQLRDWRLVFRGVADIEPAARRTVHGGLWRITPRCEASLDLYEGVRSGLYLKRLVTVRTGRSSEVEALVYVMGQPERRGYAMPPEGYLAGIRDGYLDFGLDLGPLRQALAFTGRNLTPWSRPQGRAARMEQRA